MGRKRGYTDHFSLSHLIYDCIQYVGGQAEYEPGGGGEVDCEPYQVNLAERVGGQLYHVPFQHITSRYII